MVITPTLTYASGTWTLPEEHEKQIRSTQRKMLRLIVQTKRKDKKKDTKNKAYEETKSDDESTSGKIQKENGKSQQDTEDETDEGNNTNIECDQDRDTDEDIETAEIEVEEWIDCIKMHKRRRRKDEGCNHSLLDWNSKKNEMEISFENSITLKVKMDNKAAKWNPWLSIGAQVSRRVGRPIKKWEDDITIPQARGNGGNKRKRREELRHMYQCGKRPKEMEKDYVKR